MLLTGLAPILKWQIHKISCAFSVLQLTDLFSDFHGAILILYEKRDDGRIPDKPINSNSTNPSLAIGKFTTDHGYIRSLPVWHTHPVSNIKYIICQISITYIWWTLPSCVKYIMNHSRWKYSPRLIYHCWLIWFAKSNESPTFHVGFPSSGCYEDKPAHLRFWVQILRRQCCLLLWRDRQILI